ncbi:MAG TPA: cysteine--tRNA ligase [Myxococcota bacterium]|nr:cysteine--tRNA ligase [Myxococcota bacterium]
MRLHNSLSGRVEEFVPLRPGEVRMYNCGPTVYKRQHVGNFRAFALADLLRRTFEYLDYRVTQIMNITDVGHLTEDDAADAAGEDKLEREARQRALDPWQIAREEEANFRADLAALAMLPAHVYPRATDHVPQMIEMIEALIAGGHAYVASGNVYFEVRSFPRYGALSGNTLAALEAGASGRVEERSDKRSPHDFALWKSDPKHLQQWDSPFGRGFPGWHIECSAMARRYLGDTLDIHTGGPDNKFPHHECEIAQSESVTGVPFARYWVHCGRLELGGKKMSKREGTLFTVPDLLAQGYSGRDVRLYLIKHHYRAPLPFEPALLDEAARTRERLENFVGFEMARRPEGPANPEIAALCEGAQRDFRTALEDDLNTSAALATLHEFMTAVNRAGPSQQDAARAIGVVRDADRVLGVLDDAPSAGADDAEIDALVAERNAARKARDFARADALRKQLADRGIELLDTAEGTHWRRR